MEPYLSDLDIVRDVKMGGCTIKPFRYLDDEWYEVNDAIKKLGGSCIKATKYTKAHWRIPKS